MHNFLFSTSHFATILGIVSPICKDVMLQQCSTTSANLHFALEMWFSCQRSNVSLTKSSKNVSLGINESFSLFLCDVLRQFPHIGADDVLELEHYLLAGENRCLAPGFKCALRWIHCRLHLILSTFRNTSNDLVRSGIMQINPIVGFRVDKFSIDEHFHGGCDICGVIRASNNISNLRDDREKSFSVKKASRITILMIFHAVKICFGWVETLNLFNPPGEISAKL